MGERERERMGEISVFDSRQRESDEGKPGANRSLSPILQQADSSRETTTKGGQGEGEKDRERHVDASARQRPWSKR